MHNSEIHEHFLDKNILHFWKVWNKKFERSLSCNTKINGVDDINFSVTRQRSFKFCIPYFPKVENIFTALLMNVTLCRWMQK